MMNHEITSLVGKHKVSRRVGRGPGSGKGKTSGRGHKGQKSVAGYGASMVKEGGQMPLFRRLPKRGFNNANFTKRYSIVNISQLDRFEDGTRIDAEVLTKAGIIRNTNMPVKILGTGDLTRKLTVVADKFSRSAEQKIASVGGTVELVS
ncbi:MAG: 50S ribosomal protein L15 [Sedimentisphaerales bacterium]|nr:50S ribosomal protein L15 [Sedimentisphaerales bacterium]MBN2843489.1 50S ribosomal protein L15 [Sedimentisphaerales bacterium]